MDDKRNPAIAERLIELMLSQVSETERRRNPCLLKCERQMRDSLRQLKERVNEKVSYAEQAGEEEAFFRLVSGGVRCDQ